MGTYTKSFSFLVQWVSEIFISKVIQLKWGGNQFNVVHCDGKLEEETGVRQFKLEALSHVHLSFQDRVNCFEHSVNWELIEENCHGD